MGYEIKAIETMYSGYLFRSRLEARWAAMFDLLGWQWTYEPFDLNGWIPDFLLSPLTSEGSEVLVEVKGPGSEWEAAKRKAEKSLPDGDVECLIIGASPCGRLELVEWIDLGSAEDASEQFSIDQNRLKQRLIEEGLTEHQITAYMLTSELNDRHRQSFIECFSGVHGEWDDAVISDLRPHLNHFDFCAATQSFRQRLTGYHEDTTMDVNEKVLSRMWGEAHRKTRFVAR